MERRAAQFATLQKITQMTRSPNRHLISDYTQHLMSGLTGAKKGAAAEQFEHLGFDLTIIQQSELDEISIRQGMLRFINF